MYLCCIGRKELLSYSMASILLHVSYNCGYAYVRIYVAHMYRCCVQKKKTEREENSSEKQWQFKLFCIIIETREITSILHSTKLHNTFCGRGGSLVTWHFYFYLYTKASIQADKQLCNKISNYAHTICMMGVGILYTCMYLRVFFL